MPLEQAAGDGCVDGNIVNDHYSASVNRRAIDRLNFFDSGFAERIRDIDIKCRALAESAANGYAAALEIDHALAYCHSEAASGRPAAVFAHFLRVRLEQMANKLLAYADSCVGNLKMQDRRFFIHLLLRGKNRYSAAGSCKLVCVGQKVVEYLPKRYLVADNIGTCHGVGIYSKPYALCAHRCTEHGIDLVEHRRDVERLCIYLVLAAFDLAHVHDIVQQAEKILGRLVDLVEIVAQLIITSLADHLACKVCKPGYGVHGRAYLMRHVRQKLALCTAGVLRKLN